jgi:hypothetical protein
MKYMCFAFAVGYRENRSALPRLRPILWHNSCKAAVLHSAAMRSAAAELVRNDESRRPDMAHKMTVVIAAGAVIACAPSVPCPRA